MLARTILEIETTQKMFMYKIAFLVTGFKKFDAISNYVHKILRELSKYHAVSLFAFVTDRPPPFSVDLNHFTRRRDHNLQEELTLLIRSFSILKQLVSFDVVVVTTHPPPVALIPIILLLRFYRKDVKLIWDFHGLTPANYYSTFRRKLLETFRFLMTRILVNYCNGVIVHSLYMLHEFSDRFKQVVPVDVIPIGINTQRFNPNIDGSAIRKKFCLVNECILLYVGRLEAHKRVHFLLEGLQRLDEEVKLIIVGNGTQHENLLEYIKSFDLANRAFIANQVSDEDLPTYYAACDIFVTASLHEGICLPILEALSCGKPVVVPRISAMPETAGDGGLLYSIDSIENFVSEIKLLRKNKSLRQKISTRGLKHAARLDENNFIQEYRSVLEQHLNG